MKFQIMILNTMKYQKEGENNWKSRLAYIIPTEDAYSDNPKFRGFSELAAYRDDDKFFTLIPKDFIGKKCEVTVREVPSRSNPLKSYKEFVEVTFSGKTVSLV